MSDGSDAISGFWEFWTEHRGAIERAIHDGTLMEWAERIGEHVHRIDPDLDWEMGKGLRAEHYFCVSPKGDSSKRLTTERWRSRGPAEDSVFEFHAARPGGGYSASQEIAFGPHAFGAGDFRFGIELDGARRRVHIAAWHPTFARVEPSLAGTACFVMLDAVFGEDDVERWIGAVDLAESEPSGAVDFAGLAGAVDAMRTKEETYTLMKGQLPDGAPVFVTANLGVKRVDHLLMDLHLEVTLTLRSPTEHGLPTTEEGQALDAAEDELLAALASDAVSIGRETTSGRRTLHLHVANGGPAVARVDAWAAEHEWPCEVRAKLDPQWEILRRW